MTTITLHLRGPVEQMVKDLSARQGLEPNEAVIKLLEPKNAHQFIEYWRTYFVPLAEEAGICSDEDVDRAVADMRRSRSAE
jgi:hypothetical protein